MTQQKHSIAFSEMTSAVNTAVERAVAAQGRGQLQVDKGIIMGRRVVVKIPPAHDAAAAAKPDDHHGLATAITTEVSKQTHLQLTPQVVQVSPGHLIVGFIYQPPIHE